ncbi:MAG: flagellar basal body rod protein FlgC [Leptolinea sp.]|jgi:flagellar basal-body rod protein FlgC|nr:flagellar basal body rod protein FlgC [Leptolinea sp.]
MSFWSSLRISSSALFAQRLRLDTISNNVANAETTKTEDGKPYQRKDVVLTANNKVPFLANLMLTNRSIGEKALNLQGVKVAEIRTDTNPGETVYEPTNPDADENGYVTYPNVNLTVEMTNMLSATRSYEANLAMVDAAKTMANKAIEIGG